MRAIHLQTKRSPQLGLPQTEETRRTLSELLVTNGARRGISGAILYDETIRQQKKMALPLLRF